MTVTRLQRTPQSVGLNRDSLARRFERARPCDSFEGHARDESSVATSAADSKPSGTVPNIPWRPALAMASESEFWRRSRGVFPRVVAVAHRPRRRGDDGVCHENLKTQIKVE